MNKIKKQNEKGITLIALVITIIVLIILAGVAISMLSGDNGILRRATDASEKTDLAGKSENSTLGSYEDVIAEATGNVPLVTDVTQLTEPVAQKTKYQDANGDIAVIPRGFKVSSVAKQGDTDPGEQTIKTGLVVIAPDGSEFVWVPVENVNEMYGTDASGNKLGKLYDFTDANSDNNTAYNWREEDGVMSWLANSGSGSYREPDVLESTTSGDKSTTALNLLKSIVGIQGEVGTDDDEMINTWKKQLQKEFNEMIESVSKNKGFYVARYETSLNNGVAQSVKGEKSATAAKDSANTWYGLYQKEKEYSEKNGIESLVGSTMIWGSQYDQMLIWMQGNEINVINSTPITGASKNPSRTTGTAETDKLNNVYDLLGNSWEWTLEAVLTDNRVYRRR